MHFCMSAMFDVVKLTVLNGIVSMRQDTFTFNNYCTQTIVEARFRGFFGGDSNHDSRCEVFVLGRGY